LSGRGRILRELALAVVAGVLAAYGEPGVGLAPLFPLGVVGLAFVAARAPSIGSAGFLGVAFGAAMFAPIMSPTVSWGAIAPVALTWVGVALYGVPLALWSRWAAQRFGGWALFVATASAWALWMDAGDLVGFPSKCEALSAVAFVPVLLGGCRLFGANISCGILTAGFVCTGIALIRLPAPSVRTVALAARPIGVSCFLLMVASAFSHAAAPASTGSITVGVPQLDVSSDYFKLRQALPQQTDQLEDLLSHQLQELANVDLVAFTETYDGAFPLQVPRVRERFRNRAKLQHQALLLTSYLVDSAGGGLNAVAAIDANGELVGVHRKVNLAPFGEVELERGAGFRSLSISPNVKVGVLICQEALLAEGSRALAKEGANLLVTTTSDISFGSGILGFGHLGAARLRAIETGRSMVWASNGGPSGLITRWGEFRPAAPFLSPAAAKMQADLFDDSAPFTHCIRLWPVLCGGALLWLGLRSTRSNRDEANRPRVRTARGAVELTAAVALSAAATVGSPALVEVMSGDSARAGRAVLELLGRAGTDLGPQSLARFHTDAAHSAEGALAFYLDYYGDRRSPGEFVLPRGNPTLTDLSQELAEGDRFPTREVQLNFRALPRASAIVQTKSGKFGVLTSNSLAVVGLFMSDSDTQVQLTYQQAQTLLRPSALLPAIDPALE
jgi:apolipoprotein N-acyltransferase